MEQVKSPLLGDPQTNLISGENGSCMRSIQSKTLLIVPIVLSQFEQMLFFLGWRNKFYYLRSIDESVSDW